SMQRFTQTVEVSSACRRPAHGGTGSAATSGSSKSFDAKQTRHALVAVDALDCLTEQRGNAEHRDRKVVGLYRRGVRGDQFVDHAALQALDRDFVQDAMADGGTDATRTMIAQDFGGGGQRASGLGDVVNEEDVAACDFADQIDRFDFGGALPFLGDE